MEPELKASGFVVVGGRSSRMGRDKALLPLGGVPLALHIAGQLQQVVSDVTLLGTPSTYLHLGLPVLPDAQAQRGPLAGLCAGLENSPTEWSVFVACDMPYVDSDIFMALLHCAATADAQAVVPHVDGLWQPLCAAYHSSCLPVLQAALQGEERSVVRAFARLRVHPVSAEELGGAERCSLIFRNANTPDDWQLVRRDMGGLNAHIG